MKGLTVGLIVLLTISLGFSFSNVYGQVDPNNALILEGSGFAVTEEIIRISEIDLAISTQQQTGSSIRSTIEDGFITLDDEDYLPTELKSTFLREGKYIRINGNIENESGNEASVRFFGRLVEESTTASVYWFTGRITVGDDSYKIIYATKLSTLSKIKPTPTESTTKEQLTIQIMKGASSKDLGTNYIGLSGAESLRYFSLDRISIEPGTSITIVNNDVVSHSIFSGKENYGDRHNPFTADGRIATEDIQPGKSLSITFDDAGFYRLYDPNYPWMKIVAYVFPNINNLVIGQSQNLGN
ncbi:hypothetical protein NsoK4_09280 [Nitrosopumilus sp. K4]|uniref:cupredoxin domain-containing protein n=1 Tax=Nitrosopumilus sp. K4 TaxID=2795383 RepID=UPI001BA9DEE7|nr:plastocyanin/azurin family copper-binding protein [Nitrosopumilus sp. K4]QUC64597.1 hypothetical protein NsoK4_09280 [Nitrosopumilus sp. K4]